jgi:hypothetical protein
VDVNKQKPALLYEIERLILRQEDKNITEAAQMRFLRKFVGVCRRDYIGSEKMKNTYRQQIELRKCNVTGWSGKCMWTEQRTACSQTKL